MAACWMAPATLPLQQISAFRTDASRPSARWAASRPQSTLDARGMTVTPGFLDIHRHADLAAFRPGFGELELRQGLTTIVNGNCGLSAAPFGAEHRDEIPDLSRADPGQGAGRTSDRAHGRLSARAGARASARERRDAGRRRRGARGRLRATAPTRSTAPGFATSIRVWSRLWPTARSASRSGWATRRRASIPRTG